MEITRNELIERVKTCMEELTPQWDGTAEQTEGVSIERYIDTMLDEQLRMLFLSAPVKLLPVVEYKDAVTPVVREDGSGRMYMNEDFLRPVSLQMQGWERPVVDFIDISHPTYELQFNKYTRGGVSKPVAVCSVNDEGRNVIDYYSLPATITEHIVDSFLIVLVPDAGLEQYDFNPVLVDAWCYRTAASVYDVMGNHSMYEILMTRYVL